MLNPQDWLLILSSIGFLISVYSWWAELNLRRHPKYIPFCDFNDKVSCSKNFKSKYSHVIGISNSLVGIIAYAVIFIFASLRNIEIVNIVAFLAVGTSLILAYLSYFKLRNFCLVCTIGYLVNIALLLVSYNALS